MKVVPGRLIALIIGASLLAGGVGGGIAGLTVAHFANGTTSSQVTAPSAPPLQREVAVKEESSVLDVVRKALPGVVTIINAARPQRDSQGRLVESTSIGSGVVLDERGYIVTNEHVIRDSATLRVILPSGEERPGVLVGQDQPFTDLAVVKIQEGGLKAVALGDSDRLEPGQMLVAIGTTLKDFRGSVTVGVVSGIHRSWPKVEENVVMEDLIQTDAAINHGNSGGALLNAAGELVGISTTVVRTTDNGEAVQGMAFAISSKTIAQVAGTIIKNGSYPRPFLGISAREITPEAAQAVNLPVDHGAFVTQVSPDSPASAGGLKSGDIIVRMGKFDLTDDFPYINALGRFSPGDKVSLGILRNGKEQTVEVTLKAR